MIEPLIARQEYRAAMALLMTWLSEGETVPLEDPSASFEALCERWVRAVAAAEVVPAAGAVGARAPVLRVAGSERQRGVARTRRVAARTRTDGASDERRAARSTSRPTRG